MKNIDFYYIFFFPNFANFGILRNKLWSYNKAVLRLRCANVLWLQYAIHLTNSNVLNFHILMCSSELTEVERFCSCSAAFYRGLCYHLWMKDHVFWKTFYKPYSSFNLVSLSSFFQTSLLKQMHACFSSLIYKEVWRGIKMDFANLTVP